MGSYTSRYYVAVPNVMVCCVHTTAMELYTAVCYHVHAPVNFNFYVYVCVCLCVVCVFMCVYLCVCVECVCMFVCMFVCVYSDMYNDYHVRKLVACMSMV